MISSTTYVTIKNFLPQLHGIIIPCPAPWLVLLEQVVPMIDLLSPDLVPGTPAHVPATARISAADKMTKF